MPNMGEVGEVIWRRADFTFKVKNFSSLSKVVDSFYDSPEFHFQDRRWHLRLCPNGERKLSSKGFVGLYLCLQDSDNPIRQPFSLCIQAADGKNQFTSGGTCNFEMEKAVWGFPKIISRSELFRRRHELLPHNVLTVTATLKEDGADEEGAKEVSDQTEVECKVADVSIQIEAEHKVADVSIQTKVDHKVADVSIQTDDAINVGSLEVQKKSGGEKVLRDIKELWVSGENSDVILKVQDTEFKAHRNILAVRTPALGAMFQHDTAEKASGEATIDDCEPAVFEQLLHYVYTGVPRVLNAENAAALYVVADKYLVSDVKALCVGCMKEELCLDTFCDYAELSLVYEERELLEMAIDFLSRHTIPVMKTVEWQRFSSEHSTWGNEIMIRALELAEGRNGGKTS